MKVFFIIWLVLALVVSVFVVAALMRSSQLSQQEGLDESYDDWQITEPTQKLLRDKQNSRKISQTLTNEIFPTKTLPDPVRNYSVWLMPVAISAI